MNDSVRLTRSTALGLAALLLVLVPLGACSDDDAGTGGAAAAGAGGTSAGGSAGSGGQAGGAGGGTASGEICDNSIDDDGDGAADCDDRDCALAAHCPPWCEAAAGARCYYVDAVDGDDGNDGTFEAPFRTYLNLVTYYGTPGELGSTAPPATAVDLEPGDAIYLMAGTYTDTYNYHGDTKAFFVRSEDGDDAHWYRLEAYPGEQAVLTPGASAPAVELAQSSYWHVRGLEIDAAWQRGLSVSETDQVVAQELLVHDVDGVDNDNIAGVYLVSATNVQVLRSTIHDNYDRTAADTGGQATENSSNVVVFGGGNVTVADCHVYNTLGVADDKIGGCIKYKHMRSLAGGTFDVTGNRLENCRFFSVGTGSPDSTISGNLVLDSAPFALRNFGGPTELTNIRIAYNTVVDTSGLSLSPDDEGSWVPLAGIEFSHNVVVDDQTSYNTDRATVRIGSYGSDEQYAIATAAGVLTFEHNCYFNPNTALLFDLFGSDSFGPLGDLYDFAGWQGAGYDGSSFDTDPELDADYLPAAADCAGSGYGAAPESG